MGVGDMINRSAEANEYLFSSSGHFTININKPAVNDAVSRHLC